jgi:hypothetical protein
MATVLGPGLDNNPDLVKMLKTKLRANFRSYAGQLDPNDGDYGDDLVAAVAEFQRRAGLDVDRPGWAGPKTLARLGLNFDPPPRDKPFFYSAAGTLGTPFQGPPFDVGWALEQEGRVRNQPIGYPAGGFFGPPGPQMSYNESVALGVAEGMRLINMNPGKFILSGYSQGAEVIVRILWLMAPGGPLAHRAPDCLRVITFGSPCRIDGPTLLGNNPPGKGISGLWRPDQFADRVWDFVATGRDVPDMYACTDWDHTELNVFYGLFTKAETELPFIVAVMQWAQQALLPSLDMFKLINTGMVAARFFQTNPHVHYHDWPQFNGATAIDCAKQLVRDVA